MFSHHNRKEGKERLIRIVQRNGRFHFQEEQLNFDSLKELVLHFRIYSLKYYNSQLDIKLIYPCGKPDQIEVYDYFHYKLLDK